MIGPSIASSATSISVPAPVPTISPSYRNSASPSLPSPITILPSIATELSVLRIASHAARSAIRSSPLPMKRAAASAAASVARTTSRARFRSIQRASGSVRCLQGTAEQRFYQVIAVADEYAGGSAVVFGVATRRAAAGFELRRRHQREWHRFRRMSLELARCRMIGHQQDREIAQRAKPREHRPDDQLVDTLDRFLLQIGAAHVTGFVGRLDMQQQEVARLQRFEAVTPLCSVVSIEKSGRSGNLNQVQSGQPSQSVDEI